MKKILIAFGILLLANIASAEERPLLATATTASAIFAGGCFWCLQPSFDATPGVTETVVGYIGGTVKNPSYEQVSTGSTGHREAIKITFDPRKVSYQELIQIFWEDIDPTQTDGQFADLGSQYRTAIFYYSEDQRILAEKAKSELGLSGKFKKPIATEILPATEFYPAEDYHQKYYKKAKQHYESYKIGSGRAGFIENTWKEGITKPDGR